MKSYIELESTSYWQAKALKEIKAFRRQRGREAAESMFMGLVFIGLSFGALYVFTHGWLDNVDVLGGFNFCKDVLGVVTSNVSEFMRHFK